jgi:hypothetical protein
LSRAQRTLLTQSLILSWSLSLYVWKYRKFSEAAFVPVFAATKSIEWDIDDYRNHPSRGG